MRILLINCPIRLKAKPNCLPYGLGVIASILRLEGHDVDVYDINALRPGSEEIIQSLNGRVWDIAGVSGLITTGSFQRWITEELKRINPGALVVTGGGFATSVPDYALTHTSADIAVIGEGEVTMAELCRAIEKGQDYEKIPGVWSKKNNVIITGTTRANVENLDNIPFPAWDLFPMDIYLKHPIWGDVANNSSGFKQGVSVERSMNIITSRGCPFSCRYCYHLFGRSSYRHRSPQHIISEMQALIDTYNVDFFGFNDDNTMASEVWLREFCSLLKEKRWNIHWGCHGRVSSATPGILNLMAESGCVWIGYGIESGSQRMLDAMNKKTTVEKAREAVLETRKAGIFANTTFIFGYPGEDVQSIRDTIEFKKSLDIHCGSFFATPYPGTDLYSKVRSFIPDEEAYIASLGDATDYTINLTGFDEATFFHMKKAYDLLVELT